MGLGKGNLLGDLIQVREICLGDGDFKVYRKVVSSLRDIDLFKRSFLILV